MTDDATTRDADPENPDAGDLPEGAAGSLGGEHEAEERSDSALPTEASASAVPAPPRRPAYGFLIGVSIISLAADLATKWWAKDTLEAPKPGEPRKIEVVKDHINLIFARNHGGAWGILGDESEAVRRPFFLLISVAAVVFIVSLFRKLHPSQRALKWGLPLVLGGALGNLVDRIRYGFVVDFIQIRLTPTFVWPTFNVADIAIVVGVGLMAIDMFIPRRAAPAAQEKAPAGGG